MNHLQAVTATGADHFTTTTTKLRSGGSGGGGVGVGGVEVLPKELVEGCRNLAWLALSANPLTDAAKPPHDISILTTPNRKHEKAATLSSAGKTAPSSSSSSSSSAVLGMGGRKALLSVREISPGELIFKTSKTGGSVNLASDEYGGAANDGVLPAELKLTREEDNNNNNNAESRTTMKVVVKYFKEGLGPDGDPVDEIIVGVS